MEIHGKYFFWEKNYDLALQCYENAVEINHTYIDALHNIAMTYKILGRNDDAEKTFGYIKTLKSNSLEGNLKDSGYFLSKSEKKPMKVRYQIIENKVGVPLWLYGFAVIFVFYGAAVNRIVGGIMWAAMVLGIGYFITKIRIKNKKGFKIRFLSFLSVMSYYNHGCGNYLSRSLRNTRK